MSYWVQGAIFTIALVIVSCSSTADVSINPGTAGETVTLVTQPDEVISSPPAAEYVDPAVIKARRPSGAYSREQLARNCFARSTSTAMVATDYLVLFPGNETPPSWAMFEYPDLLADDPPLVVEVTLTHDRQLPDLLHVGFSDYTRQTWEWVSIQTPVFNNYLEVPDHIELHNAGGTGYITVLAEQNQVVNLESVALVVITENHAPPQGLSVSRTIFADSLELNWTDCGETYPGLDYDCAVIERALKRSGPWEAIQEAEPGCTYFEDTLSGYTELTPVQPLYYRLRTVVDGESGWPSPVEEECLGISIVTGFSASDDYYDSIHLTWDGMEFAEDFVIQVMGTYGWQHIAELDGSVDSYEYTLGVGEQQLFRIEAKYSDVESLSFQYEVDSTSKCNWWFDTV